MAKKLLCTDCPAVAPLRRGLCSNCYRRRQTNGIELPPLATKPEPCKHEKCHRRSLIDSDLCRLHENARLARIARAETRSNTHDVNGYAIRGCRCTVCREAHSAYRRDLRQKHREELGRTGKWAGKHGNHYSYSVVKCRCYVCTAWHAAQKKAPAVETPSWPRLIVVEQGSLQTTHWVPAGEGTWTCASCDFAVDRSVPSTTQQRDAA